ncbi:unnamed protein product [Moneuplotes crassus]|uniref:Uncharacterized protein n=1 Tax=Euplotes crassus TaxID=5936 RepID=A0AAD2DCK1_EUPCR|nr:unnamed protein product [Moneuplotes crassus]
MTCTSERKTIGYRNPPLENLNNIKVIKAPKFANKGHEKQIKPSKPGRNEPNISSKNFCFVLQPQPSKIKSRLNAKRNSLAPPPASFQVPRVPQPKAEEHKKLDSNRKRESSGRRKLKISIKTKEKDNSRFHSHKLSLDIHQRSNQNQMPEFDALIEDDIDENNAASERYTSSLIENFDQSEYIKNVIIQSKKIGGSRFGSPSQNIMSLRSQRLKHVKKEDKTFMKDMKKYGILKAFNDINKFTEFFESTPNSSQCMDSTNFGQKHCSSQIFDNSYQDNSLRKDSDLAEERNTTSVQLLGDIKKDESKAIKSFKCIFPFQRRARSHSPPKNNVISNKIIETMSNNSPEGVLNDEANQKSTKNKPVIANANFIIGSYHLLSKKDKLETLAKMQSGEDLEYDDFILQGKEVEEWLMGSGIPETTTGCTDDSQLSKQFSAGLSSFLNTLKNRKIQKQKKIEESPSKEPLDDCGALEEWMFDSLSKDKENDDFNNIDEDIPQESSLDGNCLNEIPSFPEKSKRSPYIAKDQIIEEDINEGEYVDSENQFGFQNLNSYIDQMDRWIEEGKTFK